MRIFLFFIVILFSTNTGATEIVDLSSPEATLSGYLKCFEKADVECVLKRYHGIKSFQIQKAHTIEYKIIKKLTYGQKEVEAWNSKGIKPVSEIGDVELQVQEEFSDYNGMWSYNFRNINGKWYIISHSAWGVD